LANCGNLKFPDLNFTDFGGNTLNFTDFVLKKTGFGHVLRVICPENFFSPYFKTWISGKNVLRKKNFGPPPVRQHFWGKYGKKYGKIGAYMAHMAPW
jgi:hypothetical protein